MFATPLGNPAFGGEKDSEVVIKATSFIKFTENSSTPIIWLLWY